MDRFDVTQAIQSKTHNGHSSAYLQVGHLGVTRPGAMDQRHELSLFIGCKTRTLQTRRPRTKRPGSSLFGLSQTSYGCAPGGTLPPGFVFVGAVSCLLSLELPHWAVCVLVASQPFLNSSLQVFVLAAEATPVKPKTKITAETTDKTILRICFLTSSQWIGAPLVMRSRPPITALMMRRKKRCRYHFLRTLKNCAIWITCVDSGLRRRLLAVAARAPASFRIISRQDKMSFRGKPSAATYAVGGNSRGGRVHGDSTM